MASVPPRVLRSLAHLRSSIFQTSYNPTSQRTGAKYLKSRLRGPSMVAYYPPRDEHSIGQLNRMYPGWNLVDVHEVRRNISIQEHKDRGKGAPKKAKDKCTSCSSLRRVWATNLVVQRNLAVRRRSDEANLNCYTSSCGSILA